MRNPNFDKDRHVDDGQVPDLHDHSREELQKLKPNQNVRDVAGENKGQYADETNAGQEGYIVETDAERVDPRLVPLIQAAKGMLAETDDTNLAAWGMDMHQRVHELFLDSHRRIRDSH
jgi:hypothetical protein